MTSQKQELRVKPYRPPPEKVRITFRLPAPTIGAFQEYLSAYAEIYHVKPNPDFVANQILTAFFDSDRVFAAYRKKVAAAESAPYEGNKVAGSR